MFNSVEKIYLNNEFVYYLCILQDGKKMSVPLDEANSDYQAIMEYIENGGTVIDNGGGE
jgi:hypothetical protein